MYVLIKTKQHFKKHHWFPIILHLSLFFGSNFLSNLWHVDCRSPYTFFGQILTGCIGNENCHFAVLLSSRLPLAAVVLGNSTISTSGSKLTGRQTILVVHRSQPRVASSHWTDPVSHRLVTILVIENIWEIVVVDKQRLALGGFRELNQRLRRLRHLAARPDRYAMRIFSSKIVAYFRQILRIFICQTLRIFLNFVHHSQYKLAHEKILGNVTIIGNVTL